MFLRILHRLLDIQSMVGHFKFRCACAGCEKALKVSRIGALTQTSNNINIATFTSSGNEMLL